MGHLTFVPNRLSVVGNKRISQFFDWASEPRSRVIVLVDSTWVFLLLSFYIVISWNMPLFKVWSEDKLNKKFVVAENFANLFPKVNDSVCIRLFHECIAWQGAWFDTLWSSNGWGIWPSKRQDSGKYDQNFSKKSNALGFARGGGMGSFWIDRYIVAKSLNAPDIIKSLLWPTFFGLLQEWLVGSKPTPYSYLLCFV